jgi:penicillin-binding protein 1A
MRFRSLVTAFISLCFTSLFAFGVFYIYFAAHLPSIEGLKHADLQVPMQVFSSDGVLIAEFGSKHRRPLPLTKIPKQLIQAVLATEDKNFFHHGGVDFIGLVRAARIYLLTGKKQQGASTITMQVARNFFLSRKKTFLRKIEEIFLAIKIDQSLSKETILSLYLNKIFFGERAYGVEAAARIYYGKPIIGLTLPQLAMLAGLPQAPSRNMIVQPKAAKKRRNHVLMRMYDRGYIDQATYQAAIKTPLTAKRHRVSVGLHAPYVAEMVRQYMVRRHGKKAYTEGYRVYTTVSSMAQKAANKAVVEGLLAYDQRHGYREARQNLRQRFGEDYKRWQGYLKTLPIIHGLEPAAVIEVEAQGIQVLRADGSTPLLDKDVLRAMATDPHEHFVPANYFSVGDQIVMRQNQLGNWILSQHPDIEGALVSLDPYQGSIKSLVGGFSYQLSHFNRVTQAFRQPGSVFKPFVYTAALAKGSTFATIINDAPVVKADSGEDAVWRPNNYSKIFYGPTRLRIGLIKSRNIVSIRLLDLVGISFVRKFVARFGFDMTKQPKALSLALGAGLVTPLAMARGYAVFANGGYAIYPYLIDHINDQRDQLLQTGPLFYLGGWRPPEERSQQVHVISPQLAYLMHTALKDVVRFGTARGLKVMGRHDLAGKTGTTNNQLDAWFSGYNADYVTVVWAGYDQKRTTGEYGAQLALPIWRAYMGHVLQGVKEIERVIPAGLVRARINAQTGFLASGYEQHTLYEWFRQGLVPKAEKQPLTNVSHHRESPVLTEDLF